MGEAPSVGSGGIAAVKLMSFIRNGKASYGICENSHVRDIGQPLREQFPDLKSLLAGGLLETARSAAEVADVLKLGELEFLPPIPNPGKILCIGLNYEDHRVETGRSKTEHPTIFTRFADTQVGHLQPAWVPTASAEADYEGELAVIIGRAGRRIAASQALTHVAGYSCYDDISIRDWQRHTSQYIPGKNFPRTGGFGPWIVTADEIADPGNLDVTTRLNGSVVQHASTAQMIFPVPELIAYISSFTPLSSGDVIITGTPGGVGFKRQPPLFLRAGDTVEVEISNVGMLRNPLIAEPA